MDGNRRFANRRGMDKKSGHEFGSERLISILRECYELGVKYVTIYASRIKNFRRSVKEVDALMDLMQQKQESIVNRFAIRVQLMGNLEILRERVRNAAEKATSMSKANDGAALTVCVAYTSTREIVHAVQDVCNDCIARIQGRGIRLEQLSSVRVCGAVDGKNNGISSFCRELEIEVSVAEEEHIAAELEPISVKDIEGHLYTSGCPNPDLLIFFFGNPHCVTCILAEFCGLNSLFGHLLLAVLDYQRTYPFLKQKQTEPEGMPSHSGRGCCCICNNVAVCLSIEICCNVYCHRRS